MLAIGFIFLGSCLSNDLVWELADLFNQLMVLPNVLALVTLGGLVAPACRRKWHGGGTGGRPAFRCSAHRLSSGM